MCVQKSFLIAYFGKKEKKSADLVVVWVLLIRLVQGLASVFPALAPPDSEDLISNYPSFCNS